MRLTARQVKAVLKAKGWRGVDLAAHWGHSVAYISWLVNNPLERPAPYDDAFRGLLPRSEVDVVREDRHRRKKPQPRWTLEAMYPIGRVFVALDSALGPEEGTEMAVSEVERNGEQMTVTLEILTGHAAGDVLTIMHGPEANHLSDTGQGRGERLA